jgi:ATPase subunit of ABC transporter with duplicated ATPase domains
VAHLLGAERLRLEYPTKVVFDDVTIGIGDGDRIGVVGRNGDGKSSLIRMLAGVQEPDGGRVTRRGGLRIGMLDQSDALPEGATVGGLVADGRAEYEWAGDARIRDVVTGLVGDLPWEADVETLSGGQRRRVALAALLAHDWDLVILDEPTNHLDVEGIAWLAEHIKRRWATGSGALLVVTHDRWFLDEVSTTTWEVHDRMVEPFDGGYAAYILQRVERDRQSASSEAKRLNLAKKELAWLRRGAPARTTKPKFRIDAANTLIADVPEIRDPVQLQSLAVTRLGKDVVDVLDVSVSFPTPEGGTNDVLHDITWRIAPGERSGILGVNGAGKSTLLGLVTGAVMPTAGRVKRGKTVRIATLTQRLDELEEHLNDPVRVVVSSLRTSYTLGAGSKAKELTPGELLERLGFASEQLSTPVKDLSGGQRRRLQLLLILLDQPNVLILDEPTNDLDTDMLAALEDLLDSWAGTLLVVSHDRYFMERVTDQQYAVLNGRLRHLPGGVDEYLRLRAASGPDATGGASTRSARSATEADPVPERGRAAGAPESKGTLSGAEKRTLEKEQQSLERRIKTADAKLAELDVELAGFDYSDTSGKVADLQRRRAEQFTALGDLEQRWLEVSEILG